MVEAIYIHLGDEYICLRLFHRFLHLAETLFLSRIDNSGVALIPFMFDGFITLHCYFHYFLTCYHTILFLLISILTCWLPVLRAGDVMPHTLLRLLKAHQPYGNNKIFLGGMLGCKVQSGGCLATGLQYCYVTEARQHKNSIHPFIVSSHTTDAEIEEKSRTLSLLFFFFMDMFYKLII